VKGKKTNRNIYGGKGRKAVYADGAKVELTDDEAAELESYWSAREAYNAEVKAIKARYGA